MSGPGPVPAPRPAGLPGVGKTALALSWAHQAATHFRDGQLYVDLQGYANDPPINPLDVLGRFLRALGARPDRIPAELDEAAALYRSLLSGKQVLVLLDNAPVSSQVRPLLPGSLGCAALTTSRDPLAGLVARDGASQLWLDRLTRSDAVLLLRNILGEERADAEPTAIIKIAALCAFLPLALRIAAGKARARPGISLARLAASVTDARSRLDGLTAEDDPATSVRTVFSWSFRTLPASAARMFRLFGLHDSPEISASAAAVMADSGEEEARQCLETLARANLVTELASGRFRLVGLLRLYAAEQARTSVMGDPRLPSSDRRSAD